MAYTKQNWECGDLITADKMNHIEDGIEEASSGGVLTVNVVTTDPALNQSRSEAPLLRAGGGGGITDTWLDKTWQQIYDAFPNVRINWSGGSVTSGFQIVSEVINTSLDGCAVKTGATSTGIGLFTFVAETTDGYPKLQA